MSSTRPKSLPPQVKFKINSVICAHNHTEDMNEHIQALNPCRWKVFQVLQLEGENSGAGALRNVADYLITKEQFDGFVQRHAATAVLVPESNAAMQNSYLILDEKMRFLNCTQGAKTPSRSILDVPVAAALAEAGFDRDMFHERKGEYDWTKATASPQAESEPRRVGRRSKPSSALHPRVTDESLEF